MLFNGDPIANVECLIIFKKAMVGIHQGKWVAKQCGNLGLFYSSVIFVVVGTSDLSVVTNWRNKL